MAVDEAMLIEELIDCHGSGMPGPEKTGKLIGPSSKMWESSDIVTRVSHSCFEGVILVDHTLMIESYDALMKNKPWGHILPAS